MKADLHFHSKFSDGSFWPRELVRMAKEKQLDLIALTDHDTFKGIDEFLTAARHSDIKAIAGIEIDFVDSVFGFNSELLAYFPLSNFSNTEEYLTPFFHYRQQIAEIAIKKATRRYNASGLSLEKLIEHKLKENVSVDFQRQISLTKPDIFFYFLEQIHNFDYNSNDYHRFKKDFFNDPEFSSYNSKPEFTECLRRINQDKGFAVLAHPAYQFNKDIQKILANRHNYINNLRKAKDAGLWGIELHSYDSVEEAETLNDIFAEFAELSGLHTTTGSDFHCFEKNNYRTIGCVGIDFKGFL